MKPMKFSLGPKRPAVVSTPMREPSPEVEERQPPVSKQAKKMWRPGEDEDEIDLDKQPSPPPTMMSNALQSFIGSPEEDYMAEGFAPKKDIAPTSNALPAGYIPTMQQRTEQSLESGLSTFISEDNKGFAMLAKMGYKKGMGLGKQGTGIAEPIPIEIREKREGLGLETKFNKRKRLIREGVETVKSIETEFAHRARSDFEWRKMASDLKRAIGVCQQMDARKEITSNSLLERIALEDESGGEEEKQEPMTDRKRRMDIIAKKQREDEKRQRSAIYLTQLARYLRTTHHYCLWGCGVFETEEELESYCPGEYQEDHEDM